MVIINRIMKWMHLIDFAYCSFNSGLVLGFLIKIYVLNVLEKGPNGSPGQGLPRSTNCSLYC
jgi:hypothetical protein